MYNCTEPDSGLEIHLIPGLGGIINGLFLNKDGGKIPLLDYYDSPETYQAQMNGRFVNAVLAPYPNRINGGSYTYRGQTYQFEELFDGEPNSIHGLLLRQPFEIKELESSRDTLRYVQYCTYEGEDPGYPFPFYLEQEIVLEASTMKLACTTRIKNTGQSPAPMGFGQHIYLNTGTEIDQLEVDFPGSEVLTVDQYNIPTGNRQPLPMSSDNGKLRDTQLDNALIVDSGNGTPSSGTATVRAYDPQNEVELRLSFKATDLGYLQLYTPPDRHAIGVEPMSCAPDAFNNGMGLKELPIDETWKTDWQIQISRKP